MQALAKRLLPFVLLALSATNATMAFAQPDEASAAVSTSEDVNYGPFMADLQRRIKKQWCPPRGQQSRKVTVTFQVHADGTVTDLVLSKPSWYAQDDQAALAAVKSAGYVRPLPVGAPEHVDIEFTFDYNVFCSKGSQSESKTSQPDTQDSTNFAVTAHS